MRTCRYGIVLSFLLLAGALLMASCAGPETSQTPMAGPGKAAPAADSLEACMAAIPKDATAGQRTMAEDRCKRATAARDAVVGAGTARASSPIAAGTEGDTLSDCMARIPKGASAGQRMIAEESCKRDEAARQDVGRIPQ